jgi:hypothetical protein
MATYGFCENKCKQELDTVKVSPTEPTTDEKVWIQKGKNLVNVLDMLKGYSSATILEKESNRIVVQGVATTFQYLQLQIKLKAGTYTFQRKWRKISGTSVAGMGGIIATKLSDSSTVFELGPDSTEKTFTITGETEIAIYFYLSSAAALTDTVKIELYDIQLEQNTVATEYEPYIDKKIYCKNDNGVFEEFVNVEGIKTITNSNGTAIKYPDGTLICIKKITFNNRPINNAWGTFYYSEDIECGAFAQDFVGIPNVTKDLIYSSAMCMLIQSSYSPVDYNTAGSIVLCRPTSTQVSGAISITAIGRWK